MATLFLSPGLNLQLRFTVYCGTLVHTPYLGELEVLLDSRIGVDSHGTIVYIKDGETNLHPVDEAIKFDTSLTRADIDVVQLSGDSLYNFFFPGFVDTHIHAPQYPNSGIFGNSELYDWLSRYTYPIEKKLQDHRYAKDAYDRVVRRTLANGTTFAAYYATIHADSTKILADIALGLGQRAYIGRTCQDHGDDYVDDDWKAGLDANLDVIKYIQTLDPHYKLIKPILTPRNANRCTLAMMFDMASMSRLFNLPIQVHMDETIDDVKMVFDRFPNVSSYAQMYDNHNLLTSQTILGHCVHLTESGLDLVKKKMSGISHCPTSNSCLTSGEAHVRAMLDKGIKVGLGTDVSGGYSPSILTVVRLAVLVSRHVSMKSKSDTDKITVNEALYLATQGGANVCGMGSVLGSFTVGKKWECQQIHLNCENSPLDFFDFAQPNPEGVQKGVPSEKQKFQDMIDKWVFNGDDRNVKAVYVNGREVLRKPESLDYVVL